MKRLISLLVVLGIVFTFAAIPVQAEEPIVRDITDSASVRLLGRGEMLESGGRTFNWPNAGIEFTFTGTKAEVYISDLACGWNSPTWIYFNVSVDGAEPERIGIDLGKKGMWYTFYEGESVEHTVRFVRSSEPCKGTCAFSKIRITGTDIQPTEKKTKFIEFLGDSYTSGYGNLGVSGDGYTAENTDNWQAFPGFVARHFDADYTSLSYQGKGVLYNHNGSADNTMADQFLLNEICIDDALNMSTESLYSFKESAPDIIVVFLGTNDSAGIWMKNENTLPQTEKDKFKEAYDNLLETIREKYPLTHIIAVSKDSNCMKEEVSAAVAEMQKTDNALHRLVLKNFSATGVGSHPTVEEHKIIANEIIEKINSVPGIWDVPEINEEFSLYADYNAGKIMINGKGVVGDEVSALVTSVDKTINDIETNGSVVHLDQTAVDTDGDYKFVFDIEEGDIKAGVYNFYMNSYSASEMTTKDFCFETLIPSVRLENDEIVVDELSDVTAGNNIRLTVSGFDKGESFKGIVFLAQYDEVGIIKKIDVERQTGGNSALRKELEIETSVAEGIKKIKVVYMNEDNKHPVTGVYVID